MSPPEPFTHSTFVGACVKGSRSSSFADVLPPPKLVTVRSDPSRLERYNSNSGGDRVAASVSDQRLGGMLKGSAAAGAARGRSRTSFMGYSFGRRKMMRIDAPL